MHEDVEIEVRELEPTRVEATLSTAGGTRRLRVVVPAGVGVPGATDEELVDLALRILVEREGVEVLPHSFELPWVLARHPDLLAEVERRLEA